LRLKKNILLNVGWVENQLRTEFPFPILKWAAINIMHNNVPHPSDDIN
jgi:hypothetical protein